MPSKDNGVSWRIRNPEKVREYKRQYAINNREKYMQTKRGIIKEKRQWLASYKEKVGCADCHNKFPSYILDLDHRDGKTKVKNVSHMVSYGWEVLKKEVEKCDVVCSNCHRTRTYVRRMRDVGEKNIFDCTTALVQTKQMIE